MGRIDAEFTEKTKRILAKRVGERCSNPSCRKLTSRPHPMCADEFINVGEAAHIKAASNDGPRYDDNMTDEDRKNIKNGIWLCQQCHKVVDNKKFSEGKGITAETLLYWKKKAEINAAQEAAYLDTKAEKYDWVIETLNNTKSAIYDFKEKWSSIEKPEFDDQKGSQDDAHRFLMDAFRQQSKKQDEFDDSILGNINLLIDLSRIILEEGNPLITDLKVAINEINKNEEKTITNLIERLDKLVNFITVQ
jgi:hypothetical protein